MLDLDDPRVLVEEGLRPSHVSTGERARTQVDAVTLFDRAEAELRLVEVRALSRSSTPSSGMPPTFSACVRADTCAQPTATIEDDMAEATLTVEEQLEEIRAQLDWVREYL